MTSLITGQVGENWLNLQKEGEDGTFLGQTLLKVMPKKVTWVVKSIKNWNLTLMQLDMEELLLAH